MDDDDDDEDDEDDDDEDDDDDDEDDDDDDDEEEEEEDDDDDDGDDDDDDDDDDESHEIQPHYLTPPPVGGKNTYNVTGARFPQKSRALGSPPHTKHRTSASPSQIARPTPTLGGCWDCAKCCKEIQKVSANLPLLHYLLGYRVGTGTISSKLAIS